MVVSGLRQAADDLIELFERQHHLVAVCVRQAFREGVVLGPDGASPYGRRPVRPQPDHRPVLLKQTVIVLRPRVHLVGLDQAPITSRVETAPVDLGSEFAHMRPLVLPLLEDQGQSLVQRPVAPSTGANAEDRPSSPNHLDEPCPSSIEFLQFLAGRSECLLDLLLALTKRVSKPVHRLTPVQALY
jgi:hypothetical protein